MNIRLPAQLGRPLQVSRPIRFLPPLGQAAVIDPLPTSRPLQRPVRFSLPRLAGLVQPVSSLGRPRLPRPSLLRGLGVVAPEPLLHAALDPVVPPLGEHHVTVRILPPAPVHRQRVGQPLPARHLLGEGRGQIPALPLVQLHRQGELELAVEPPVRPLVSVGSLPIGVRVVLGPLRHVAGFGVLQLRRVAIVAPFALDVIGLGRRRLPTDAAPEARLKMKDRHAAPPLAFSFCALRLSSEKREECALTVVRDCLSQTYLAHY